MSDASILSVSRRALTRMVIASFACLLVVASAPAGDVSYGYDSAGRLRRSAYPSSERTVVLDAAGNRKTVNVTPPRGRLQFVSPDGTQEVREDVNGVIFNVQRVAGSFGPLRARCEATGGTAVSGSDYLVSDVVLTWSDGDTENKSCNISIKNDAIEERTETVTIRLVEVDDELLGANTRRTLSIRDDDGTPLSQGFLSFDPPTLPVSEGAGTVTFTVRRVGATGAFGAASALCSASQKTAGLADYDVASQTLSWAAGDASPRTCAVTIKQDTLIEGSESFQLSLSQLTGAQAGSLAFFDITIADDEAVGPANQGTLRFSSTSASEREFPGAAVPLGLAVLREGVAGAFGPASARCQFTAGTAGTADYTVLDTTVQWAAGDATPRTCRIQIEPDTLTESDETVTIRLTDATGATLGTSVQGTLTIRDDDSGPPEGGFLHVVSLIHDESDSRSAGAVIERRDTSGPFGPASVRCDTQPGTAVAGQDYTFTPQTLTWAAGDAEPKRCFISVINDDAIESDETLKIVLSEPAGARLPPNLPGGTFTIRDDESRPSEVRFIGGLTTFNETAREVRASVIRDGFAPGFGPASVVCRAQAGTATAGADYVFQEQVLTWGAGDGAIKSCSVQLVHDAAVEPNEQFTLTLSDPIGTTIGQLVPARQTVFTIKDVPPAGVVRFVSDFSGGAEADAEVNVPVIRLDAAAGAGAVSVLCSARAGTATAGQDYQFEPQVLSWAAGDSTTKFCKVRPLRDNVVDANEQLTLVLSDVTGGARIDVPREHVVTLAETPPGGRVQFSQSGSGQSETISEIRATVNRLSATASAGPLSVLCQARPGSATAGQDYMFEPQVLTWAAGDTSDKTCRVEIVRDAVVESEERLTLTLSNLTGDGELGNKTEFFVSIIDTVPGGRLQFVSFGSLRESGGELAVTVGRFGAVGAFGPASVRCQAQPGTATAGADYVFEPQVLTWAAGDATDKFCRVRAVPDAVDESDEQLTLVLSDVTGDAVLSSFALQVPITILNVRPGGRLQFRSSGDLLESGGELAVSVGRFDAVGAFGPASVRCQAQPGTATAGADYVFEPQVLTWAAGDATDKFCRIKPVRDAVAESDEQLTLVLSDATGDAVLLDSFALQVPITIRDVPPGGRVEFIQTGSGGLESVAQFLATVRRVAATESSGPVSVRCDARAGTATAGQDYQFQPQVLTWAAGETADKTCRVDIVRDAVVESEERLTLTLSNLTGDGKLGDRTEYLVSIFDVPPGGRLNSLVAISTDEGHPELRLFVTRDEATSAAGVASVRCEARAGTASAGTDYVFEPQVLTWAAGDRSSKSCSGRALEDGVVESDEQFTVVLTGVTGDAQLGGSTQTTVTIRDARDEGVLVFAVANSAVNENAGVARVAVQRREASGPFGPASIVCRATQMNHPDDFVLTEQTLTWAAGDASDKFCEVRIVEDALIEPAEVLFMGLDQARGARTLSSAHTLSILDNDQATSEGVLRGYISVTSIAETGNFNGRRVSLSVLREGASGGYGPASVKCDVTAGSATAGQDYSFTPKVLQWAAGQPSQQVCFVDILQDSLAESAETFSFRLSEPTGAMLAAPEVITVTIEDDETAPINEGTVGFERATRSAQEGNSTLPFLIRAGATGLFGPVSVRCEIVAGTATEADYVVASQTITWAAGDLSYKSCPIQTRSDTLVEGNEQFKLRLTPISGAAALGITEMTITILDDDRAP